MTKAKVAIYCRVSTEHVEQDQSYKAQLEYFTEKFKDKYEIVNVYADRGSGLAIKKRPQFQKMLYDAGIDIEERKTKINTYVSNREPKFKYILTKSVSRFSRNTEIIGIIRDLKNKGVFVIFDDVNKSTESQEDTMLLEFLQSIAQEESRNKSQIIKWGKKRSAEAGHVAMQSEIYGYKRDFENNKLIAITKEAKVIQKIFNLALNGCGVRRIKKILTEEEKIFNREGKSFSEHHLMRILKNPRYCGLNIRNRYEKTDLYNAYKQKEKAKSEWIVQETDKIDKIIEKEQFDEVQKLIVKRSTAKRGVHLAQGEFAQKIKCSVCGAFYTRNREIYRTGKIRVFYNCSNKKKNGVKACNSRNVGQDELEEQIELFRTKFWRQRFENFKKALLKKIEQRKIEMLNNKNKNKGYEIITIKDKIKTNENKLSELLNSMIENPSETLKKVYNKKIQEIEQELKKLENKLNELEAGENRIKEVIHNLDMMKDILLMINIKNNITREKFLENVISIDVKEKNLNFITEDLKFIILCEDIIKGKTKNYKLSDDLKRFSNNLKL